MALIKCKECGKEISDKATNCIHCGCPVNSITKERKINDNKEEKSVYKTIIDNNSIRGLEITIDVILFIFSYVMGNIITMDFPSRESFIYGVLIFIPLLLITIYIFNNRKKSYLIATTKHIKGEVFGINKVDIYIPLEKVNSITTIQSLTGTKGLHISSSLTNYTISYIKNAEQFKNIVLDLIDGKDISKYDIEESNNNDVKNKSTFFNRYKFLIIGLIIGLIIIFLLLRLFLKT